MSKFHDFLATLVSLPVTYDGKLQTVSEVNEDYLILTFIKEDKLPVKTYVPFSGISTVEVVTFQKGKDKDNNRFLHTKLGTP
ncbi:MAG TPA: hypothetical protein VGQ28_10980 [Thermoanaerobaculia bacterium]|nr:hypothetical protein [Thermoanaerobaculia bacterium]